MDDSPDGTAALVLEIARTNPRVRVLQRVGCRGRASACMEGMMATPAPYIAVMDGDLQHDEGILPAMLEKIRNEKLDLVVATRNAEGGGMGEFSKHRVWLSNLGRRLSQSVSHTNLSDPMSGFIMLDRGFLEEVVPSASGVGFKILLDLVASSRRPVRFGEVPYTFRKRIHGTSTLDIRVGLEYLQLLLDKVDHRERRRKGIHNFGGEASVRAVQRSKFGQFRPKGCIMLVQADWGAQAVARSRIADLSRPPRW